MNEALALRDLHFGYGSRAAVRGVSLQLQAGDCYGFLGHNGAGKTTVMRLCLGLLRPARGSVRIFGIDPSSDRRRANSLVGALIERPGFHLHVSARQNLVALARLQGIAKRLANAEVGRVIECVGLNEAMNRKVGTFSMGMRQRLGIAQALLGKPRLLFLDEPTNGLDPEGIADLRALLHRLTREEGTAIMLSSHQLAELDGLCNRVGVLREGSMVIEGDLDSLRQRVGVRHVITGEPVATMQRELEGMNLQPTRDGDRLLVNLGEREAHEVTRALAAKAKLASFAPEQATLERIYLHAATATADTEAPPAPISKPEAAPAPQLGSIKKARRRAFGFELTTLLHKRSTLPLLALPCVAAALTVSSYGTRVGEGLAKVETGEQFSADAGSGYLAVAQSMQTATPVLALAMLWLASQTIAGDLAGDTMRNSLIRSVRRKDILFGKVFVLLSTMMLGWLAAVVTSIGISWATVGFGNLEEITRFGDRELLANASGVWPTMLVTLAQMTLPMAAIVTLGAAASAVAKRPALALAAAAAAVLVPELARDFAGERGGWLLTSHLPIAWRDESALNYLAAVSRGAADAVWVWSDQAVYAPVLWLVAGSVLLSILVSRLRIS
ncbi:MAG: ABC-type multidrug transport system ATPase subunit [Neolewinella sp.]